MSGFQSAHRKMQSWLAAVAADASLCIMVCPHLADFAGWSDLDSSHLEDDSLTLKYGKRNSKKGQGFQLDLWEGEDHVRVGKDKIEFSSEGEMGVALFGPRMTVYSAIQKLEKKAMKQYECDDY